MARKLLPAACAALLSCLFPAVVPALAGAATTSKASGTFEIRGGGFGHGIGMSQYGAMGYALHGWSYPGILAHYYEGTSLATVPNSTVTVLLSDGAAAFKGATVGGGHTLDASKTYGVLSHGSKLELISDGHSVGTFSGPLKVTGSSLDVIGKGDYAGSLEFYPDGSGAVLTVNAVDLEDYVEGVIAEEMPSSWPQQALEAQAVAARTYVLADTQVNSEYDVYSDTRSQMYGGISAETSATNQAASATTGRVVEESGKVIPTYFFASSGGHTESIQNVWLGETPAPYLSGVADPYDDSGGNPYYRWTDALSLSQAASRLAGLYKGSFEGIKVLQHGVSPRIVAASVVGTKGASTVSGAELQEDLDTMSTWMSFTTVTAKGSTGAGTSTSTSTAASTTAVSPTTTSTTTQAPSTTGGAGLGDLARLPRRVLSGNVFPAVRGALITVQKRNPEGHWSTVGSVRARSGGAYAVSVLAAGVYRAVYDGADAPAVSLG